MTQYDARTDAVIYGDATASFDEGDWIRLVIAAADQAGMTAAEQNRIAAILRREETPCE